MQKHLDFLLRGHGVKQSIWIALVLLLVALGPGHAAERKVLLSAQDYEAVLQNVNDDTVFQRFLDKVPTITVGKDVKRTYYVIEGDLRLTREQLRAHLRSYLLRQQPQTATQAVLPKGQSTGELYVMTKDGVPTKWSKTQRALTFAIDRGSFTADVYGFLVNNMPVAAAEWVDGCECGLSITHRPEFDSNPQLDKVTFIVTYAPNQPQYYAVAFFPADPVDQRYLHIMDPFFTLSDAKKLGVLTHEIGHILGYRHGHISGVPGCETLQEPNFPNWVALGPYDSKSVMHYMCGGGGSEVFALSPQDKRDHKTFYSD